MLVVRCDHCQREESPYGARLWYTVSEQDMNDKHFCSKKCLVACFSDAPMKTKDYPEVGLLRQLRRAGEEIKTWPEWMQRALAEERAMRRHITGDVPKECKDS